MGSQRTATAAGIAATSGTASGSLVRALNTVAVGTSIAIAEGWEQERMSVRDIRNVGQSLHAEAATYRPRFR